MKKCLILMVCAATGALAEGERERPAAEQLAREAIVRWAKLEYRPASTGGLATVNVDIQGSRGNAKGVARYRWHRTKGVSELAWDPASLGRRLAREGWARVQFEAWFLPAKPLAAYKGCTLAGKRAEDGGVVVAVVGKNANGVVELAFDKNGVLTRSRHSAGGMKFTLSPTYERFGKRYIKTREVFAMKMAGFGDVRSVTDIRYRDVDGRRLPVRMEEATSFGGAPSEKRVFVWSYAELE